MRPVILETERLQLLEMTPDDRPALSAILQDEAVMYAYNGAFDDAETDAWMQRQLARYKEWGFGLWGVYLKDTGRMIGQCGITMQDYRDGLIPEIGYLFARAYWHQGYATEAAVACREYGFHTLGFDTLYSIIRDTNLPSRRVASRNGMQPFDTIIKHYRGAIMPHLVYRVTRE